MIINYEIYVDINFYNTIITRLFVSIKNSNNLINYINNYLFI